MNQKKDKWPTNEQWVFKKKCEEMTKEQVIERTEFKGKMISIMALGLMVIFISGIIVGHHLTEQAYDDYDDRKTVILALSENVCEQNNAGEYISTRIYDEIFVVICETRSFKMNHYEK